MAGWLANKVLGIRLLLSSGNPLPLRKTINFTGAGVTAVDNPGQDRIDVTVDAAAGSVSAARRIDTMAPLTGGGDLSANRSLAILAASVATPAYVALRDNAGGCAFAALTCTSIASPGITADGTSAVVGLGPEDSGTYYSPTLSITTGGTEKLHLGSYNGLGIIGAPNGLAFLADGTGTSIAVLPTSLVLGADGAGEIQLSVGGALRFKTTAAGFEMVTIGGTLGLGTSDGLELLLPLALDQYAQFGTAGAVSAPAAGAYRMYSTGSALVFQDHAGTVVDLVAAATNAATAAAAVAAATVDPTTDTLSLRDGTGQLRATSFATASAGVAAAGAFRLTSVGQTAVAQQSSIDPTKDVAGLTFDGGDGVWIGGAYATLVKAHTPLFQAGDVGGVYFEAAQDHIYIGNNNTSNAISAYSDTGFEVYDTSGALQFSVVASDSLYTTLAAFRFGGVVVAPQIIQDQRIGTGGDAGETLTLKGQQGQAQTGTAANNDGGKVVVSGGDAGLGGSGAPGHMGDVALLGNALQVDANTSARLRHLGTGYTIQVDSTGTKITGLLTVDQAFGIKYSSAVTRTSAKGHWDLATANASGSNWTTVDFGSLVDSMPTATLQGISDPALAPHAQFFFDDLPDGAHITAVSVWILPWAGHAAVPTGKPAAKLWVLDVTTFTFTSIAAGTDTSATVGAYETIHAVGGAAAHIYDASKERIWVDLTGEYDANSLQLMRAIGAQITYTIDTVA